MISGSISGEEVEACEGCAAVGACPELCDGAGFSGVELPQSQPIAQGACSGGCETAKRKLLRLKQMVRVRAARLNSSGIVEHDIGEHVVLAFNLFLLAVVKNGISESEP